MPKIATRRVYFAALAVPVAMVLAPLTASAGVPDDTAVAGQGHIAGWYEPADVDVAYNDNDDTNVTYVVNGIHDDSVTGAYDEDATDEDDDFSPGPDWYYYDDDVDVASNDNDETNVTYVVNGIHDDSVTGNHEEDADCDDDNGYDNDYGYVDEDVDHDDVMVDADNDYDLDHWSYDSDDSDDSASASYEDFTAFAGSGGAWVDSMESGAFSHNDNGFGHVFGDDDDAAGGYYEDTTAGAGSGGAFVGDTESGFTQQG